MTSDRAAGLISILGAMVLVGRALLVRRRRVTAGLVPMALVWIAIFVALFGVAHWLDGHE